MHTAGAYFQMDTVYSRQFLLRIHDMQTGEVCFLRLPAVFRSEYNWRCQPASILLDDGSLKRKSLKLVYLKCNISEDGAVATVRSRQKK